MTTSLDTHTHQGNVVLLHPTGSDGAGARQRKITFQGKTAGGTLHTLLEIIAQHEGGAADQKCETLVYVNDGNDGTSPTLMMTIASTGIVTFASTPAGLATAAGVAAGYQPLDSNLTAIAALSTTSYGRALLALADAAALRTAGGLGTVSTLDSDTDGTLAANSDSKVATQKAVKTYVDAAVTGLLEFKGATDCSGNPNYPAASKGDSYVVSVAGKIGGASGTSVEVGDVYLATADNAGGTQAGVGSSWTVLEHNLVGAVIVGGALGTPSSGTLTNCSGLPAAGVTGLASVATSGSAADLGTGTLPNGRMPALTGDVTSSAGAVATTITNDAVTTAKIINGAVTLAKQASVATLSFLGRLTASSGVQEVLTWLQAWGILAGQTAALTAPPIDGVFIFSGAVGSGAGTASLRYQGPVAGQTKLIVPAGYKLMVGPMSGTVSAAPTSPQTVDVKLYEGGVDKSSNFTTFQFTNSVLSDWCEPNTPSALYVVDATGGMIELEMKVLTSGATGNPTAQISMWAKLIRP